MTDYTKLMKEAFKPGNMAPLLDYGIYYPEDLSNMIIQKDGIIGMDGGIRYIDYTTGRTYVYYNSNGTIIPEILSNEMKIALFGRIQKNTLPLPPNVNSYNS